MKSLNKTDEHLFSLRKLNQILGVALISVSFILASIGIFILKDYYKMALGLSGILLGFNMLDDASRIEIILEIRRLAKK